MIGVILIILTGVAAGLTRVQRLGRNLERLKVFRDFLIIIKRKISFSALSMEELIQNSTENEFASLLSAELELKSIPNAFRAVARSYFRLERDAEAVLAFFSEFGRDDLQNQIQSMQLYIEIFDARIAEASAAYKEKFKVNVMLYSFIGVAVALVLI